MKNALMECLQGSLEQTLQQSGWQQKGGTNGSGQMQMSITPYPTHFDDQRKLLLDWCGEIIALGMYPISPFETPLSITA